jgi:hypothetical protein
MREAGDRTSLNTFALTALGMVGFLLLLLMLQISSRFQGEKKWSRMLRSRSLWVVLLIISVVVAVAVQYTHRPYNAWTALVPQPFDKGDVPSILSWASKYYTQTIKVNLTDVRCYKNLDDFKYDDFPEEFSQQVIPVVKIVRIVEAGVQFPSETYFIEVNFRNKDGWSTVAATQNERNLSFQWVTTSFPISAFVCTTTL